MPSLSPEYRERQLALSDVKARRQEANRLRANRVAALVQDGTPLAEAARRLGIHRDTARKLLREVAAGSAA